MMIRYQDKAMRKYPHQLDEMPSLHLKNIARERGIELVDDESIKENLNKKWLRFSVDYNVSDDFLIWTSIIKYSFNDILAE